MRRMSRSTVCTVRRATVLLLKEKAELIERAAFELRAESITLPRPVVIRLITYAPVPRDTHRRKITRRAVFARDRWTCQYCGSRSNLTVDHVVPRSKGGGSTWENIVASCAPCNRRKGDGSCATSTCACGARRGPPAPRSSSTSPARQSRQLGGSICLRLPEGWWSPGRGRLAPGPQTACDGPHRTDLRASSAGPWRGPGAAVDGGANGGARGGLPNACTLPARESPHRRPPTGATVEPNHNDRGRPERRPRHCG